MPFTCKQLIPLFPPLQLFPVFSSSHICLAGLAAAALHAVKEHFQSHQPQQAAVGAGGCMAQWEHCCTLPILEQLAWLAAPSLLCHHCCNSPVSSSGVATAFGCSPRVNDGAGGRCEDCRRWLEMRGAHLEQLVKTNLCGPAGMMDFARCVLALQKSPKQPSISEG